MRMTRNQLVFNFLRYEVSKPSQKAMATRKYVATPLPAVQLKDAENG